MACQTIQINVTPLVTVGSGGIVRFFKCKSLPTESFARFPYTGPPWQREASGKVLHAPVKSGRRVQMYCLEGCEGG